MLDLERMLDDFVQNAKPTNIFAQIGRKMEVADLKEVYDRKYLLESGLVTTEEYATIPASTFRADNLRTAQDTAYLMTQVVGQEEPNEYNR